MNANRSGSPGYKLAAFPKEFERNFWETFDKRYYSILLATFMILFSFFFVISRQEWELSADQIEDLKRKVIQKVYDAEIKIEEPVQDIDPDVGSSLAQDASTDEEPPKEVSERGQERLQESQADRQQRRQGTREDIINRQRRMQQEVANQGILAIATGSGGAGAGNVAYSDVLRNMSGSGGVSDIGEMVEGTAGIRTAQSGGDRTRAAKGSGFRTEGSGGTGIDELISGESVGGTSSFDRRGSIQLKSDNVQLTAGAGSRDPDAITASINKQASSVEYCYQRRAKVNPNLRGRIDLEIQIAANGNVDVVRTVNSTLNDSRLVSCIERAVKRWRFGSVDTGSVRIRVPFIF
ncbi:MAG TPA: AgmX/PglI C-terminal domain-containing protein [Calditrichia bacterium]|nr:AgmX/PglI C-terminal domain-containing protein [Calditrichota bacterium]HQU73309.1 AgmX/PglI C-terminal domain-containing protein [Calditrichia bacterium]HQV33355.1 AgmX/PglI C-terminal domain-containing protein [Calditrichia bacterium]